MQLVRLRNPWGNDKEWKGNWGDKDEKWKSISEEEKEKFKVVKSSDGEFYMAFDDYVELFVVLVVELAHESAAVSITRLLTP